MRDFLRLRRTAAAAAGVLTVAVAVTAGATFLPTGAPPARTAAAPADVSGVSGPAPGSVKALQERLRRLPGDHQAWAALGAAYVQQARVTADPSSYTKAEQALDRAARLAPGDFAVLTGQAALAAGRHEFAAAVRLARRATEANPYGATAYGVLADAYTQLGDYPAASRAVRRMTDLRPGVSSFTRASYDAELRGDTATARTLMEAALQDAFTPEDRAYCRYHLGELSLRAGDLGAAVRMYDEALRASPGFLPARAGLARAAALGGDLERAAGGYAEVVERLPLPQYVVEYGEVLEKLGRDPSPQWTLLRAQKDLMAAAGVRDDITWAEFEADHGSPATAVRHARAEYARNPNMVAADALAWALHKAGRPREALPYTREATALGWRNALIAHHRALIEKATGRDTTRFTALTREYNPRFDPALPSLARFT
ncbi:tetratricopeptide repeat protein [Sphaerisporangium rubeum]|uniref:Tetratricopeptide (TPR) repeat protein n=1 Tax=Sphaerisporangium rubeum TaxID=321317 RepID=A0A7X0ID78_9ACTN|nr:tetratricopeptide repeat protein [Sphaerisporangium rubeum]MBB6472344.1 tetratricopeptide (TPR) repeat protein [Sphaerisporangium rubeum]